MRHPRFRRAAMLASFLVAASCGTESASDQADAAQADTESQSDAASQSDTTTTTPDAIADSTDAAIDVDTGPLVDVLPVSTWVARFAAVEPYSEKILLANSKSADSWLIYESGYYWEGYVSMYEATGDTKYLDKILTYTDNWIASALPCNTVPGPTDEPAYKGWASKTGGVTGEEVPLYESYGWRFIARLLYVMRDQKGYEAQFKKLLAFTETNIWDKWYSRSINSNLYRQNMHMASHWAYIAMFLAKLTESPTRRDQCLTVMNNISHAGLPNYSGHSLHSQLIANPVNAAATFWNYDWGKTDRPGSDVNHGEAVANFAVEAHQIGITQWTATDMKQFAALLGKVIWPTAGDGAANVDGTGTGNGWLHGWAKLGRFDVDLHRRLEKHPAGINNLWFCGNMAVSARILRGVLD